MPEIALFESAVNSESLAAASCGRLRHRRRLPRHPRSAHGPGCRAFAKRLGVRAVLCRFAAILPVTNNQQPTTAFRPPVTHGSVSILHPPFSSHFPLAIRYSKAPEDPKTAALHKLAHGPWRSLAYQLGQSASPNWRTPKAGAPSSARSVAKRRGVRQLQPGRQRRFSPQTGRPIREMESPARWVFGSHMCLHKDKLSLCSAGMLANRKFAQ
jgi:hypothetical protein